MFNIFIGFNYLRILAELIDFRFVQLYNVL